MNSDNDNHSDGRKVLPPAALRALQEAEERRKATQLVERAPEIEVAAARTRTIR